MRSRSLICLLAFLCCTSPIVDGPKAHALVAEQHALLLDVRTPEEFAARHLEGSINVPVDELDARLGELESRKAGPIIVYCKSGSRAERAKIALDKAGFSKVYNLRSIDNWEKP